jgi:hypothetical protein
MVQSSRFKVQGSAPPPAYDPTCRDQARRWPEKFIRLLKGGQVGQTKTYSISAEISKSQITKKFQHAAQAPVLRVIKIQNPQPESESQRAKSEFSNP